VCELILTQFCSSKNIVIHFIKIIKYLQINNYLLKKYDTMEEDTIIHLFDQLSVK
jgi:hypothetical protein